MTKALNTQYAFKVFNPGVKSKTETPHQPDRLPVFTLQPAEQSPTSRVERESVFVCVCMR